MSDFEKTPFGPNTPDQWAEFQHYKIDKEKKNINFVHVPKTTKELAGQSLSKLTISDLNEIVDAVAKKEVSLQTGEAQNISQFIDKYQQKIKTAIEGRHHVLGKLIIAFQEGFKTGELGELAKLKNQFSLLSTAKSEQPAAPKQEERKTVDLLKKPLPQEPQTVEPPIKTPVPAEESPRGQKIMEPSPVAVPIEPAPIIIQEKEPEKLIEPPKEAPRAQKGAELSLAIVPIKPSFVIIQEEETEKPVELLTFHEEPAKEPEKPMLVEPPQVEALEVEPEPSPLQLQEIEKVEAKPVAVVEEGKTQDLGVHTELIDVLAVPISSMNDLTKAISERIKDKDGLKVLLQKETLSRDSVLLIAQEMEPKQIKDRFVQLEEALKPGEFEKESLKPVEILRQAIFIEKKIPKVKETTVEFFQSKKVSRPIHIDMKKKLIAVIPKASVDTKKGEKLEAFSAIDARGTSKKVVSAVAIHLQPAQKFDQSIVQITPLKISGQTKKEEQEQLKGIEKELAVYKALDGIPGIAEIVSVADETKAVNKKELPRKSILAIRATGGEMQDVIRDKRVIELETQVQWAYQLFSTFEAIHDREYIHGDIKGDNILLGSDGQSLVTDFGMACTVGTGKVKKIVPHQMYKENLYGTMEYSAPELFCRPDRDKFTTRATVADYQKTESFALGTVLYAIHKGEDLPWVAPIVKFRDDVYEAEKKGIKGPEWKIEAPRLQKEMQQGMEKCIEGPLRNLPQDPSKKTQEDHYNWVIYNVMRKDPKARWTMQQARTYMEQHLGQKPNK